MLHNQDNPILAVKNFWNQIPTYYWLPNSPDCNPFDYYVWGAVKRESNKTPCNTKDELKERKDNGARGVMVIVVGNGHGDTSSNPRRDWWHFT